MNKCIFLGRFTKDPEIKTIGANDTIIANFTLAVNRKFKKDGQPTADFPLCVAIGKKAENIEKYFSKGDEILVTTRMQNRSYEDKQTGGTRYITEYIVEDWDFTSGKKSSGNNKPTSSDDEFNLDDIPI